MVSAYAALTSSIEPQLRQVEMLFEAELVSRVSCVNTLVRHVSRFRGKMLRPMLVLLSGRACGSLSPAHVTIATVVEMVHMATLVHDDVLDDAELRRRGATINHLRGNEAAVLLGDYLISHSFHLCSSLESQSCSRAIARTTNEVCEGELLQINNRGNFALDEATYFEIITRKTASLCAVCCMLGAKLSGASEETAGRLEIYGRCIGEAFQIQDDLLDLLGDVRSVGKTLGTDIDKGKMTLPMIHFMSHAPQQHRELLRSLLESRDPDLDERIRNLILPSDSIRYAQERARRLCEQAREAIAVLPESQARQALSEVARFVVERPM
jgi:octaprenyl-diphosphate synthase